MLNQTMTLKKNHTLMKILLGLTLQSITIAPVFNIGSVTTFASTGKTVSLTDLEPYETNDYIQDSLDYQPTLTTSNYGTEYDPDTVITNCDSALYSGLGIQTYYLDGEYSRLTGTIYVPKESRAIENKGAIVQIYGDDVLLYEHLGLNSTDKAIDFDIDIYSAEYLSVRVYGGWYKGDGTGLIPLNCVTNLELRTDGNTTITMDEFKQTQPTYLSSLEPWSIDKYFDTYANDSSLIEDNYGTLYSALRIFSTKEFGDSVAKYFLDKQYQKLTGTIYVPIENRGRESATDDAHVCIYGDGKLLFEQPALLDTDHPVEIDVDIKDVEFLEVSLSGYTYEPGGMGIRWRVPLNCVADLAVI